jgi:hypothetical protein
MSSQFCAPALVALTLAAIASPVIAEPSRDTNMPPPGGVWSEAGKRPYAHGSANQPPARRHPPAAAVGSADPRVLDCVHVPFPQCGESGPR